jgi:hypothetical protein
MDLHGEGEAEARVLREVPELSGSLRGVDALLWLRGEPVWAVLPCRVVVR